MIGVTDAHRQDQQAVAAFVDERVAPYADSFDRDERMPPEMLALAAARGYFGGVVRRAMGGAELDMIAFGLLNEEIGRGCSSLRSIVTVHSMVCAVLARWGTDGQQQRWLPALATGRALAAFALTEPQAGSDVNGIAARAEMCADGYVLTGVKKWITAGQIADVFLVFARVGDLTAAFLLQRGTPGLVVHPVRGLLGVRASMVAHLELNGCSVPADRVVGRVGFGLSAVAATALDLGRYSVAWGAVGIAQACLEAVLERASVRRQFGAALSEHQLIKRRIAKMAAATQAARLACVNAGWLKDQGHPDGVTETCLAKYLAARAAMKAAAAAVQIHGALGCSADAPVGRWFRDAKVMEIIEGSTEMQQLLIADHQLCARRSRRASTPSLPAASASSHV